MPAVISPRWAAVMLLGMITATWPVWHWYIQRLTDGSDEPWGLLALATLAWLAWRNRRAAERVPLAFFIPGLLLATYTAVFPFAPPLVRAVLVAIAFGGVLLRGAGAAGLWGLLALSLPIVATLQFYLGYPLRLLAAGASASALQLCGYAVTREGTLLHWAGETIFVDAPCSGVHMLWAGFYLTFLVAAWYRLNVWQTAGCVAVSLVVIVGANMARATALFFKEAGIVSLPEWTHAGTGVAIFGAAVWVILAFIQRLRPAPVAL